MSSTNSPMGGLVLTIAGMDCADCALTLERGLGKLAGVARVRVNFATATMTLEAEGVSRDQVVAAIRRLGYDVAQPPAGPLPTERRGLAALVYFFLDDRRARLTLLAAGLAIAGSLAQWTGAGQGLAALLWLAAALAGIVYPARAGWGALRSGRGLDINVLMTIAGLGALALGELTEAATVMVLFNLGETLEVFTIERARSAVRALMSLAPKEALLLADGVERAVPIDSLAPGDRILIRPGERAPVDGLIRNGHSTADESAITGEAMPVDKSPGDPVLAGTINGAGALEVEVLRPARESTLARIAALVSQAQAERAPSQRLIDRFARWYTPTVVLSAGLIAALPPLFFGQPFTPWVYRALVLLVIACPCALVISTPVSLLAALARAARLGVLFKGGQHLEALAGIRVVAFDKTGTLTRGQPRVQTIVPAAGLSESDVLALAAAIERGSDHPVALAILREARHRMLTIPSADSYETLPGRGARARLDGRTLTIGSRDLWEAQAPVAAPLREPLDRAEAHGQTALIVGDERGPAGLIAIADQLRPEAPQAVARLRQTGVRRTVMLTGDNATTARAVADKAGIDEAQSGLLPEDKVARIAALATQPGGVAMVGDGINDAPALVRATVGIGMGAAGNDAALEAASVTLMGSDLGQVPIAIDLSQRTRRVIRQNVAFSLAVKATFLMLAIPGWTTLWMAVFADMGASILVTLNGMRLLRYRQKNIPKSPPD